MDGGRSHSAVADSSLSNGPPGRERPPQNGVLCFSEEQNKIACNSKLP